MAIQRIDVDVAMIDGTEHTNIRVVTADRMKLAATARRHKWGTLAEDTDRSITFLAWCALVRLGQYAGTFEEFVEQSETVSAPEVEDVDPTTPAIPAG